MPTILLTGASKGLGLAVLTLLLRSPSLAAAAASASSPANIITVSRSLPAELLALRDEFAGRVECVTGDVCDKATMQRAVAKAKERWGGLDSVILNAGILDPLGKIADVDVDAVKQHFDTNFFSLITAIQLALPLLRASKGSIVLVSSGAAERGYTGWGAYCAGKAAMNSLARTLGAEEEDVRTVAVRPGVVDTSMQTLIRSVGQAHMSAADHSKFTSLHTSGELLHPADPGYALAALALKGPPAACQPGAFLSWNAPALDAYQRPEGETY